MGRSPKALRSICIICGCFHAVMSSWVTMCHTKPVFSVSLQMLAQPWSCFSPDLYEKENDAVSYLPALPCLHCDWQIHSRPSSDVLLLILSLAPREKSVHTQGCFPKFQVFIFLSLCLNALSWGSLKHCTYSQTRRYHILHPVALPQCALEITCHPLRQQNPIPDTFSKREGQSGLLL